MMTHIAAISVELDKVLDPQYKTLHEKMCTKST